MLLAVALAIVQAASPPPVAGDAALRRTVADYVGLYDEFFTAQQRYLASGRSIKEELENLSIERRGKLVADRGEWKIQSLMFSYDGE